VIGFSTVQFLAILATFVSFGALLGTVPGLLLAVLLRQPRRTVLLDAAIGICGILIGIWLSSWAGLHVSFLNGHSVGPRGFLDEHGLLLAGCVVVALVSARHARLRRSTITSQ